MNDSRKRRENAVKVTLRDVLFPWTSGIIYIDFVLGVSIDNSRLAMAAYLKEEISAEIADRYVLYTQTPEAIRRQLSKWFR
jgi:hypothetical protein